MKKKKHKYLCISVLLLMSFIAWTVAVGFVNIRAIGPDSSSVGFSTLNSFIHTLTGVHFSLYTITDWLSLIPIFICIFFATIGLIQWIKRKSISKVDYNLLLLGSFYIVVFTIYFLFEKFVINYRPVLINGYLEVSYPSSTTMLVLCIMPTATMQFKKYFKNRLFRHTATAFVTVFTVFMVVARLISGVHWFSDIVGGVLLSFGLVMMYYYLLSIKTE